MKRQRNEETEARKGTNLCFWNSYLIYFNLSHSLICRFQAMPNISFKVYLHGVCGRWGIREREMLKEVRCYGLTICHPTNIFFNSNFQCNGMKRWSLLKLLQKGWKEHFQSHFMRLRLSWYQNQTRTPQEKKILANIPNKYRCKIFNKILENQIQQCMKRILDNPLQYSCLGNLRQRSLASYSPLDHKVSDTT